MNPTLCPQHLHWGSCLHWRKKVHSHDGWLTRAHRPLTLLLPSVTISCFFLKFKILSYPSSLSAYDLTYFTKGRETIGVKMPHIFSITTPRKLQLCPQSLRHSYNHAMLLKLNLHQIPPHYICSIIFLACLPFFFRVPSILPLYWIITIIIQINNTFSYT